MNTYKAIKSAGLTSIAIALLTPSLSLAEADQNGATETHNLVHRVSHSIADSKAYTRSGSAGYKWGKKVEPTKSNAQWAKNTPARSGLRSPKLLALRKKPCSQQESRTTSQPQPSQR